MTALEIVYAVSGLGGIALLIWVVRSVKKWGAAEGKEERAEEKQKQAEKSLKDIRDVKELHDTIERDPSKRMQIRDEYR